MNLETVSSKEEVQRLQRRLRRLAEEKSNLQLIVRLIEQLNPLPGIEQMVGAMLHSIVDTIGGTNIKLYYFVGSELHYADFTGARRIVPDFDDALAAQVAASSAFIEQRGDTENALLQDVAIQGSWTWGFPLLLGDLLVGVIKLENLHLSADSLRTVLPIFFNHAALNLSNEIHREAHQKIEAELAERERLFRTIADTSPLAIYMSSGVEQKGGYVNPTFTRLFGYTLEEVPSVAQWWPLAYPDQNYRAQIEEEWQRKVAHAIETQSEIEPMEVVVSCKDGSRKNISWGYIATGKQNWAFGLDLTARKQAEEQLIRYKDQLEDLVVERTSALAEANRQLSQTQFAMDMAGIGIHWIDDDGHFIYVNEYAAKLVGYTQQQMRAMSVKDVDPNFADKDFREQTRPLREAGSATIETCQRHRNGEIIPIEVTFYHHQATEESPGFFISFVTDIRQRKRSEQELRQAKDAAEAANRAKSTFLANISHELRTPLNAILGFSSMMRRDGRLHAEQRTNLDIINRSGEHLLTLINDVLEMSKIESGRVRLEITPFDFGHMVREVIDMMHLRAQEQGLQLLVEQAPDLPRYIKGDEVRLRQILINLVGNAVKFTCQGGVSVRFGVKPDGQQDKLLIEVEDTGPGMSLEDQQRLFQPFVQLGEHSLNQGTGLGLAITRQFVQLMDGTVSVESTLGKGSLFRVELPVERVEAGAVAVQARSEVREVEAIAPNQPSCRILIVEDQLENQLLMSQLMQRIGVEFMLAGNGEQAVHMFQSWRPHLIWMDRLMPVMDGMQATRAIRALPGGKDVKIVAVTASAFAEQRVEMLAGGMDDVVRKPYRASEIYECLGKQLGLRYVYAESPQAPGLSARPLTVQMLAGLPESLRSELKAALESLDGERIKVVIGQVEPYDPVTYQALCALVDDFDYPSILKVLQANSAETAS